MYARIFDSDSDPDPDSDGDPDPERDSGDISGLQPSGLFYAGVHGLCTWLKYGRALSPFGIGEKDRLLVWSRIGKLVLFDRSGDRPWSRPGTTPPTLLRRHVKIFWGSD